MSNNKDYSLWLFLDLEHYGNGKTAKEMAKILRKTPEFKGAFKHRLYFRFNNKNDKSNFIFTVSMELSKQGYRWQFLNEQDKEFKNATEDKSIQSSAFFKTRRYSKRVIR